MTFYEEMIRMNSNYDIAIVGGGASGMLAAIAAASQKKSVILLEHNDKLGKKILQTGNGRCNLTNYKMDSNCYGKEHAEYAMQVIADFNVEKVIHLFGHMGLLMHDRNGYVYPLADQATQVNDVLNAELKRNQVKVMLETNVEKIMQDNNMFVLVTNNGKIRASKAILATGSMAYPKSGSDGSGYRIAKELGHKIVMPLPALTALEDDSKYHKMISGVRIDADIHLCIDGKEVIAERGELQLTDYGLSGIPIFQISRYAVKALSQKKNVSCRVDFLPSMEQKALQQFLHDKKARGASNIAELFNGMVNKKIMDMLLKKVGLDGNGLVNQLTNKQLILMVEAMKNYEVHITGYKGFDYGQVCQGGISLKEINPYTMESTVIPGLYICGELADVDGICGGYNLQWAWSSGYKAGVNAAK